MNSLFAGKGAFPEDVRKARDAADAAGREAVRLGDECRCVLVAYGPDDPRAWMQGQLRGLMATLRAQGDVHDAMAVGRYADARVEWGKAIEGVRAADDVPASGPTPRKPKKPGKPPKKPQPARVGLFTDFGWHGNKTPPPVEAWHATVPPWEDRPVGAMAA